MNNNERDQLPPPVEYTGSAKALSNSRFLNAGDLMDAGLSYGQFLTVTIDKVLRRDGVVSQFSGRPETMRTLTFVGKKKEFRVNQTGWKALIASYGDDCGSWKGRPVQLVLSQVHAKGKLIDAIVLRVPYSSTGRAVQARGAQPVLPDPVADRDMIPENEQPSIADAEIPF
jgi:hypothetical protein